MTEYEENEPIVIYEEYIQLLQTVQNKCPEVTELLPISKSEVITKMKNNKSIRPYYRVAVCEDYPGIVSFFYVSIQIENEWFYYRSNNW